MLVELYDFRFSVHMIGGFQRDIWALNGRVFGHPNFPDGDVVHVSTPTSYDQDSKILKTTSGREYLLVNPQDSWEDVEAEIRACIESGGYSTH